MREEIAADAVKVSNKDESRWNITVSTTSTSCGTCWPSMCNAASDGDRYSGHTEPAEVREVMVWLRDGGLIFVGDS
jgi:hypothetical protein